MFMYVDVACRCIQTIVKFIPSPKHAFLGKNKTNHTKLAHLTTRLSQKGGEFCRIALAHSAKRHNFARFLDNIP